MKGVLLSLMRDSFEEVLNNAPRLMNETAKMQEGFSTSRKEGIGIEHGMIASFFIKA